MSAAERCIAACRAAGVELEVRGNRLAFDAPRGAMTSAMRSTLREHKAEVVVLLKNNQQAPATPSASRTSIPRAVDARHVQCANCRHFHLHSPAGKSGQCRNHDIPMLNRGVWATDQRPCIGWTAA